MMNKVHKNGGLGTFVLIGTGPNAGGHTTRFDINEDDLVRGVKLYSSVAIALLSEKAER